MLSPRGYGPLYAFQMLSHRALRYASPFLHLIALGTNIALLGHGGVYTVTLALQAAFVLAAAALGGSCRCARSGSPTTTRPSRRSIARRPLGPDPRPHPAHLGEGGGHAVSRALAACRGPRAALAWRSRAPCSLVAVVAIRLESPGPAIYRQRRVGRGRARGSRCSSCARWSRAPTRPVETGSRCSSDDPRVTRVGAAAAPPLARRAPEPRQRAARGDGDRRASADDPGPGRAIQPRQRRRLEVKPGLTGWAQVNGRASLSWEDRIELDVWYVEHRTLALDLRILARTVRLLLTGRGLYEG